MRRWSASGAIGDRQGRNDAGQPRSKKPGRAIMRREGLALNRWAALAPSDRCKASSGFVPLQLYFDPALFNFWRLAAYRDRLEHGLGNGH
jgi:hypothetical protein